MGRIFVGGHSHITALSVPLQTEDGANRLIDVPGTDGRMQALAGVWMNSREDSYWETLAEAADGETIAILWGGNYHNFHLLLQGDKPLDFWLAERPDLPPEPGVSIVPRKAIEECVRPGVHKLKQAMEILRKTKAKRIVLVETPPPRRDLDRALQERPVDRNYWLNKAKQMGMDDLPPFGSANLRLKAWRMLMDMTRNVAQVEMLPAPREACEPVGFLRHEYGANDLTHANGEYGKLCVELMMERLA